MVTLVPMTDESFEAWNEQLWISYRAELIRSGVSEAAADENVAQNLAQTVVNGKFLPGNFTFDVVHEGAVVGSVWLAERDSDWFIYDIEISDQFRGQGLGRSTMRAIEAHVRERGGKKIGLSVFGFNTVAQKLYLSEGYEINRLAMSKTLD